GKPPLAFDRDQTGADAAGQIDLSHCLADQRRAGGHAHPVLAIGEVVALDPVTNGGTAGPGAGIGLGGQPAPGEEHVDDATISTGNPNGVKLKNLNPSNPWRTSSAWTTRFGAVAMRLSMPLMSAATDSGIMSWLGVLPEFWAIRRVTGMKMAT